MTPRDPNTLLSKLKRNLVTCWLPVSPGRVGACRRCGACCRLPYPCPALRRGPDGGVRCAIYSLRPLSCRAYPRSPREHITHGVCGYRFEPSSHGRRNSGVSRRTSSSHTRASAPAIEGGIAAYSSGVAPQ